MALGSVRSEAVPSSVFPREYLSNLEGIHRYLKVQLKSSLIPNFKKTASLLFLVFPTHVYTHLRQNTHTPTPCICLLSF